MKNKLLVIHGHFYQPPRENPWTETLERQASARPDHDWNARVARECYVPNAAARIVDGKNRVVELVNNYDYLSFNFGPTLLSWFERAHPEDYRRLLEADAASARRLEGHGNAIAQAYNHAILPLCSPRDLRTQILWGLADFRRRFQREPEALWLPETACNDEVLRTLIDHGLRYAILAPTQAEKVRAPGEDAWKDVSDGSIETRRAYRWSDPDRPGRSIALFFYDGSLSHGIAFGNLLADAAACAGRLEAAFGGRGHEGELVHAATDGESYGHHGAFMDMGLAHLFARDLLQRGIRPVNYGYCLAHHPPLWEARIKAGPQGLGTAWSCAHGLGRWMQDCGCGAEGRHQRWRKPLREAFDWLRDRLAEIYEKEGSSVFKDVWEARDAYIDVVLDRSLSSRESFFKVHLKSLEPDSRRKALLLLEMQRHSLLMDTSCAWFFSEVSGIEAVQNLQYAARAVELARLAGGVDLEEGLSERLKLAPSNEAAFGDAEAVYRRLALTARVDEDAVAAHYAADLVFAEDGSRWSLGRFRLLSCAPLRHDAAGLHLRAGKAEFEDSVLESRFSRVFLAAELPGRGLAVSVSSEALKPTEFDAFLKGADFPGKAYRLADLLPDAQQRLIGFMLRREGKSFSQEQARLIMERSRQLGLDVPALLSDRAKKNWIRRVDETLSALEKDFSQESLKELADLVEFMRESGWAGWRFAAQTRFFDLIKNKTFGRLSDEALREQVDRLCLLLDTAPVGRASSPPS